MARPSTLSGSSGSTATGTAWYRGSGRAWLRCRGSPRSSAFGQAATSFGPAPSSQAMRVRWGRPPGALEARALRPIADDPEIAPVGRDRFQGQLATVALVQRQVEDTQAGLAQAARGGQDEIAGVVRVVPRQQDRGRPQGPGRV